MDGTRRLQEVFARRGRFVDAMRALLLCGALLAGTSQIAVSQTRPITVLGYRSAVPTSWVSRPASSSMRLAEFVIPAADSSAGAEVVIYFFGKGQGGTVGANLARWKAQFSMPDGSAVYESVARDSTGSFPITIAEYRGTYARGIGAGDANNAKPGQALIAGVAETPRGTLFIQLFGPIDRVGAAKPAFVRFVKGLRDVGDKQGF